VYKTKEYEVQRRYKEFEYLYEMLIKECPLAIITPLPEKFIHIQTPDINSPEVKERKA
jgi:hypothetical protein